MTVRPTPAERLLAMLGDPDEISALSSAELRADLAALGVDAAPVTAFARNLAAAPGMPAGRLLAAIDDSEAAESDIARLEAADLRENGGAIPQGRVAAAAAEARRKAGGGPSVVGLRRRSRLLVWGGAAGGIAASLLVAMVLVRGYLESRITHLEAPSSRPIASPETMSDADRPRGDIMEKQRAAPAPPAAAGREPVRPESLADRPATTTGPAERFGAGEAESAPQALRLRGQEAPLVAAMLLVDPARAPAQLQSQTLPAGRLAERLDEARRQAGDRAVIALYTIESVAGRQDYVQLSLPPGAAQRLPAPSPLARLLGAGAANFDFLPLPAP